MHYPEYTIIVLASSLLFGSALFTYFRERARSIITACLIALAIAFPIDWFFFRIGIWGVNRNAVIGAYLDVVPVEEALFILVWSGFIILSFLVFRRRSL